MFGRKSARKSGLYDLVVNSLDDKGINYEVIEGVRPNPSVDFVRRAIKHIQDDKPDLILAVGGGSVIDTAKGISVGAYYDGDVWDIYEKKPKVTWNTIDIGVILTIPAAGSEASSSGVLTNDELRLKRGCPNEKLRPKVAFMNPELTYNLPAYQTAAGIVDMYTHILERYFSCTGPTPVTDSISLGLLKTLTEIGPKVLKDPKNYDLRANIMWASTLAHSGLCGVGREEDWATHGLEHELSAYDSNITHGAGLAVMFPAWMKYVYKDNPERFLLYAKEVFGIESADKDADIQSAIQKTEEFFKSLGMPSKLDELGIEKSDIEKFLTTLVQNKGEVFGSLKRLTADDARKIYLLAFE